jgi:hypothetical protein
MAHADDRRTRIQPGNASLYAGEWAERFFNVQRRTEMPRGGHFAAMEQPELLVDDIRAFFPPLRSRLDTRTADTWDERRRKAAQH